MKKKIFFNLRNQFPHDSIAKKQNFSLLSKELSNHCKNWKLLLEVLHCTVWVFQLASVSFCSPSGNFSFFHLSKLQGNVNFFCLEHFSLSGAFMTYFTRTFYLPLSLSLFLACFLASRHETTFQWIIDESDKKWNIKVFLKKKEKRLNMIWHTKSSVLNKYQENMQ